MDLTPEQRARLERDGFLIFPNLFSRQEIAVLRREVARLSDIASEAVVREHTGGVEADS